VLARRCRNLCGLRGTCRRHGRGATDGGHGDPRSRPRRSLHEEHAGENDQAAEDRRGVHRLGEEERSVVNYGIPDFSSLSPHNADDHALIASIVGQTIAAFEPRLRQVRVEVGPVFSAESALWLNINAELVVGIFTEPVSFPLTLNSKSGTAEMHDSQ